eukprot:6196292-Pleurochrysis_carterae.AAC.3
MSLRTPKRLYPHRVASQFWSISQCVGMALSVEASRPRRHGLFQAVAIARLDLFDGTVLLGHTPSMFEQVVAQTESSRLAFAWRNASAGYSVEDRFFFGTRGVMANLKDLFALYHTLAPSEKMVQPEQVNRIRPSFCQRGHGHLLLSPDHPSIPATCPESCVY